MKVLPLVLAVAVFSITISTYAVVEDDGLILYFSFDEARVSTVEDGTGGGNDGYLDNAEISTKEAVHGDGSLKCGEANSSMTVESFNKLEDYQDNTFLFWLNFIEDKRGGWS